MAQERQEVVVKDIEMSMFAMIAFMVKWALASIPALFILMVIGTLFWVFLIGMIR